MGDCSSSLPVNIVNPQTRHSCTATLSEELEKRLPGIVIENVGIGQKIMIRRSDSDVSAK